MQLPSGGGPTQAGLGATEKVEEREEYKTRRAPRERKMDESMRAQSWHAFVPHLLDAKPGQGNAWLRRVIERFDLDQS